MIWLKRRFRFITNGDGFTTRQNILFKAGEEGDFVHFFISLLTASLNFTTYPFKFLNKEEEKIGRPIPDSYLAEAVIVMCDALAIIPANPNVDGEKITASAPFMNVINEHVRAKGVTRRAITVEQIEAHFKTTLNQRE